MKRKLLFCMGALLLSGTLAAQTPVPEWQAGVDKVKSLIKTNPEQASETAGDLLKGKNKKNVSLIVSVARAYLDAGKPAEAENYLKAAKKADSKDASVSVLEGDIALAGKDVGRNPGEIKGPERIKMGLLGAELNRDKSGSRIGLRLLRSIDQLKHT